MSEDARKLVSVTDRYTGTVCVSTVYSTSDVTGMCEVFTACVEIPNLV